MFIKKILSQHRRDFTAIYECEFCGNSHEDSGYDDSYFHQSVVPDKVCHECGKSTNSDTIDGEKPRPLTTKYPDWQII